MSQAQVKQSKVWDTLFKKLNCFYNCYQINLNLFIP